MTGKTLVGICALLCILLLAGCGKEDAEQKESGSVVQIPSTQKETGVSAQDSSEQEQTETSAQDSSEGKTHTDTEGGLMKLEGAHIDANGNVSDRYGNTFEKDGKWTAPAGGYVDENGYIHDKNGEIMGGGAKAGSVG
ncbi:MAG TPA: hypothetical protein IAB84_04825 [Candidatus Choladousia intestinigallinarum]|nr:hypothetical protein [Candidatus Choladousia intestinigallinarum]